MLGCEDEYGSDMPLALFTHVTQFLGLPVILLGLYNGQRLQEEPREDVLLLSRAHHGCQAQREPGAGNTAHGRSDSVGGSGQSCSFVRVLLLRGRVQGAVLIGEATEMAGGFEVGNIGSHTVVVFVGHGFRMPDLGADLALHTRPLPSDAASPA